VRSDSVPSRRKAVIGGGVRFAALLLLFLASCGKLLGLRDGKVQGACTTDAECAPGYACLQSFGCRNKCSADSDCGPGARCFKAFITTACIPASEGCGQPSADSDAADGCPQGTHCDGRVCRTDCTDAAQCAGGQTCINGGCVSDPIHETPADGGGGSGGTLGGNAGAANAAGHRAGGKSNGAGGSMSSGGSTGAAGSTNTGGSSSTGGSPSTGGSLSTAGSTSVGGWPGAGGMHSSGGTGAGGASVGTAGSGTSGAGSGTAGSGGTGSVGALKSAGCGKTPSIASSDYNNGHHIAITAGGMQREYVLNVPTSYNNATPYKLIIAYHQLSGTADDVYKSQYYHLLSLSNDSTIFVAPNGQQGGQNCTQASGCGWANPNNTDLQLADAIVAQIEDNFCVDKNRIFAIGWSAGGSMAYKTACERPLSAPANGYVRGVAVYSGQQLSGNCTPSAPVAYYASHGTQDTVIGYNLGVSLAQTYAGVNGCTWMTPTKVTSGPHVCTSMTGCTTGYPLEFCSFNGPHTPDPDTGQSASSWAYQEVWTFLSQF